MGGVDLQRVRNGLGQGVRTSLQNNVSAYGFSVMITASFGVLGATIASPSVVDVFAFLGGSVTGVSVLDGVVTRGFRSSFRREKSDVIALGAALGYVSVGLSVGTAAAAGAILHDWWGWAVGAFLATAVYVLLSGLEMTFARIAQEDREATEEDESEDDEGG